MKKEMIRELTLRIYACADATESLKEFHQYFTRLLPLDLLAICIYSPGHKTLRFKALVTNEEVVLVDETVPLSAGGRNQVEKAIREKILLLTADETLVGRDFSAYVGILDDRRCSLLLSTQVGPSQYGSLGLVSMGEDRYEKRHADLLRDLHEPLSNVLRQILSQIEMANLKERLVTQNRELLRKLGYLGGPQVIGRESGLKEVMNRVDRVAPLESSVLIMGETGVGKEVVANVIHRRSKRADKPFISFNCGAIPETLLDSELFGYEKGAFTGAAGMKFGYFEQANGGTVFLDEVGELSLQAQVKLLRLLQTMRFQRVGGNRPISINVRVIAATNRDLQAAIKEQKFRKDLWFRLNVFPIRIPPLRERKEDIPTLAEHFAHSKSREMNLSFKPSFAEEALGQLQVYDWPGNVRELQNVIERALILSQGKPLSFPNLSPGLKAAEGDASCDAGGRIFTLDELVIRHIQECLSFTKGRVAGPGGAAEILGVNPSTLRGKMRKHGIRIKHVAEHKELPA